MNIKIHKTDAERFTKILLRQTLALLVICLVVFFAVFIINTTFLKSKVTYLPLVSFLLSLSFYVGIFAFTLCLIGFIANWILHTNFKVKKTMRLLSARVPFLATLCLICLILFLLKQVQPFTLGTQKTIPLTSITIFPSTPTITPFPTSVPTKQIVIPTTDPDPIISCSSSYSKCLGQSVQIRQSQCQNIICCQVGDKWSIYTDKAKCTSDQNAYYGNQSNIPTIPTISFYPCTLYYPALRSYQTYDQLYTTKEQCDTEQALLNSGSTPPPVYQYTYSPTPTPDPYCATAMENWINFRDNFTQHQINNYSSSYEGMMALEGYMNQYQQQANAHSCNITLSL